MSLPPLKPDKTASGIIVDPRTLERVVPQSRRKDGSVRKEQRVRPGFTPQEDVGRFRSARQQASDVSAASKPVIPGSNRLGPAPSSATRSTSSLDPPDNPFAQQEQREKTKAQLKNEKRREKRREKVALSWDEEGDGDEDEDGDGGMQEAFKAADAQAGQKQGQKGRTESQGAEQNFPPIDGNGGAPEESVVDNLKTEESKDEEPSSTVAALEPAPPGPSGASFETSGETKPTPPTTTSSSPAPPQSSSASPANANAGAKPSLLADRKAELSPQSSASATAGTTQKPHPIQGGRKGPIGLAHPPPIEEDKPKAPQPSSRADADSWRKQQPKPQQQKQSNGKGKPNQTQNQNKTRNQSQSQSKTNLTLAPAPAPRERREVKVREGGHNDVSSLANRVKNLVLANTVGNAPREKTSRTATPTGSAGSAASEGKATPAA
ncbi:hypothetical protein I317_05696 [Kwoniella heveanensis CBS 569]|nr:hypothetical protein I317_05696 [Kwoniella heveanensis CBS 569]